jgi:hypothetical protein
MRLQLPCFGRSWIAVMIFPLLTLQLAAEKRLGGLRSPNERLHVIFELNASGQPGYSVKLDGKPVLQSSKLGLVRDDADFTTGLKLLSCGQIEPVKDQYEILTAKRRVNTYAANRQVIHLTAATGQPMDIIFQVSDDGFAFRYYFPEDIKSTGVRKLSEERSSFHLLPGTKAWLQPMSVAKTGWKRVHPSYEEYYEKDIPVGTPSTLGVGWVYPALFRSGDTWLLISESSLPRNYCGTRLRSESPDGEYFVGFPDERENFPGGGVNPESKLPWLTPWRLVVVGDLQTIAESTLGIDLADKPEQIPAVAPRPGKASWSWPLLGDDLTTYDVQKKFIDYAADMKWRYCLIDSMWDQQIGFEKMKELIDYARGKNVAILLWYNSNGEWNDAPQTPRHRMLTREGRVAEFEKLKTMGVAGLKIDFFGGDGQSMIAYYHDILQDAAPFGFMINFHGATLPRGWQRTYPNLMTMEAIKGLEFITFEQKNADEEPAHATLLPFTRNVFDPMDFTPMVLDRINRIQRRTTSSFELALSVLFTSGIQHFAEIPEGMAKAPDYVREFLRVVPESWDDVRFIDGFPGKFVVLARKGDGRWFVAGINGQSDKKEELTLDLSRLTGCGVKGTLITDGVGSDLSFRKESVELSADKKYKITLQPNGGFVLMLE